MSHVEYHVIYLLSSNRAVPFSDSAVHSNARKTLQETAIYEQYPHELKRVIIVLPNRFSCLHQYAPTAIHTESYSLDNAQYFHCIYPNGDATIVLYYFHTKRFPEQSTYIV